MANRFSEFKHLSQWEADLLNDAYQAISATGNWNNMKYFAGKSFVFSMEPWVTNVMNAMQYRDSHSGTSFGLTMRAMECIAKEGWDAYAASMKKSLVA